MHRGLIASTAMLLVALTGSSDLAAWGLQGHRVVALLAAARLAPETRLIVDSLLPGTSLADVAVWADDYVADNIQTGPWHYVNIPAEATQYDRDRDCPRQPGVAAGSRADRWRDCVVDRILHHQQRLADATLDRADRAIALKFLVHFVGDLHQPLHAIDTARGGNDIPVVVFGFPTCRSSSGAMNPCNLHGVWDTALIAHRQLSDEQYLAELSRQIAASKWDAQPVGTPQDWAMESHTLAKVALLTPRSAVDEAYYRAHTDAVDRRLALAGFRLAALLNQSLAAAPRP